MRAETPLEPTEDHYRTLGLDSAATEAEIKQAYRTLARMLHPDTGEATASAEAFQTVQRAYEVLGNPRLRAAYDRLRAERGLGKQSVLSWSMALSQTKLQAIEEEQVLYVAVDVRPASTAGAHRLPLNLGLVIDRSTSMQGARLEHVKSAVYRIIDELEPTDALSIVTFSDRAEVILPAQIGVDRGKAKAKVTGMWASGGTEILHGMRAGLVEVEKIANPNWINHLILLTDGQTYGDEEQCIEEARRAGLRQIGVSAMGMGEDWNDKLLDEIAAQSGGESAYIASSSQVQNLLRKRVRGLGAAFAKNLRLEPRTTDRATVEMVFRSAPLLEKIRMEQGCVKLGTLETDSPISLLLEVVVKPHVPGQHRLMQLILEGDVPALNRTGERLRADVSVEFTNQRPEPAPVPSTILSALGKISIYRLQERAYDALQHGDRQMASRQLELVSTRLFDLGKHELARAALLEAGRVSQSGELSSRGRKVIKYGTRSLASGSGGEK